MNINPILEVRNRKGEILDQFVPDGHDAIDPQAAYIVTDILSDALAKPAGSWRNAMTIAGHTVASKTGTSNKRVGKGSYPNNNVLIGYTPSMVVGVWVGNTDGTYMLGNAWGFADAGPIWKYFFGEVLKNKPDEKFTEPAGIIHKGHELFPSWVKYKNFDAGFKRADETQQTQEVPTSDLFGSPNKNAGSGNAPQDVIIKEPVTPPAVPAIPVGF
jgi:membrane peptidoglycan carboxypeptidase